MTDPMRPVLGGLFGLVALNAFGGGFYGMTGAEAIPVEWLAGSPFDSYFIPSLFLFTVIGGLCGAASIAVFARARVARTLSLLAATTVLVWVVVQMVIIGYVSWMQPTTFVAGALALALSDRCAPTRHRAI